VDGGESGQGRVRFPAGFLHPRNEDLEVTVTACHRGEPAEALGDDLGPVAGHVPDVVERGEQQMVEPLGAHERADPLCPRAV